MATTKATGGTKANRRGKELEDNVSRLLEDNGYKLVQPALFFAMRKMWQPIYARQVEVGQDIYGKTRRCDILVYNPSIWPDCLVIQCKWQASSGSVEEKYPFEVLNIQKDEYPTIVVLDGGGYSKGSESWLKNQAGKNRLKYVFSLGEIQRFASKGKL